jgi:hypothetical protein
VSTGVPFRISEEHRRLGFTPMLGSKTDRGGPVNEAYAIDPGAVRNLPTAPVR